MLQKLLLASVALAGLSTAAFAADLVVDQPMAPAVINNSFNWDGAYIGAFLQGQTAPNAFGLGVDLGVNTLMSGLVLGADLEFVASTGPNFSSQLTGKIGGAIGDSAILYAYSGLGTKTKTSFYVPLGVGAEFAVAQNVSIKAEAQYNFNIGTPANNSAAAKVGVNWHF